MQLRGIAAAGAALLLLMLWHGRRGGAPGVRDGGARMACPRELKKWHAMHGVLAAEREAADEGEGWEVLFLGDSLTERLRGTRAMGQPCNKPDCCDIDAVFDAHVASRFRAGRLGIGGDQTFHLRWRLAHGELPAKHHPKLVVLLIGTNDLGAVAAQGQAALLAAADHVAARLRELLSLLRSSLPASHVALLALLPRGSPNPPNLFSKPSVCPSTGAEREAAAHAETHPVPGAPRDEALYDQPSMFSRAIDEANKKLRQLAETTPGVTFVDCAGPLLLRPDGSIDPARMPDGLHPNAAGYEAIFSECWDGAIERLVTRGSGSGGKAKQRP